VITRLGVAVVVSCSVLASTVGSGAVSASQSCGPGTKSTPHAELPRPLRTVDGPGLVGHGTLWTIVLREPAYGSTSKRWVLGKQAWFRLEEGPVTVTGRRVDGGEGTFHFDMPPVESYQLWMNADIGPGFIPSSLEFSSGGCWKVVARLGRSRVVLNFHIDGSNATICRQLASDLLSARATSGGWAQTQVAAIVADLESRRC
jgi:hypothetical protein